MRSILRWAAFAVCAPAMFAAGLVLLYCLVEGLPSLWRDPSWRMAAWALGEFLAGGWLAGGALAWWEKLPKAAWTKRPISSFFRHA